MTPTDRQRGVALVAVLWIVASLTVLVLSFNASVRSHLDVARVEYGISQSESIIDAAIRVAVVKLSLPPKQNPWQADGRSYELDIVGRRVRFAIQDTRGLIDLNAPPPEVLRGLIAQIAEEPKEAQRLAEKIIAWRKPKNSDDQPGRTPVKNTPNQQPSFIDPVELTDVPGISLDLAARLEEFVTVYGKPAAQASQPPQSAAASPPAQPAQPAQSTQQPSNQNGPGRRPSGNPASTAARINVLTAPREILLALPDISPATVNEMIAERARTPIDKAAMTSVVGTWTKFIAVEQPGPVYRLTIAVIDAAAVPSSAVITILLTKDGDRPYYVLSRTSV